MRRRWSVVLTLIVLAWCPVPAMAATAPPWLPRYDMAIHLDVLQHTAKVTQRVTWLNRHKRPAQELIFNVHSHYAPPSDPIHYLFLAKMLEIMRMSARDGISPGLAACEITKVTWFPNAESKIQPMELKFSWREDMETALVVELPFPVTQNQSITVDVEYTFRLPQRQGRWGQWRGVTFLSNWHPVLAHYDEEGWKPTPFVPWHQPFFNEAGVYRARVFLPADQHIATSVPQERTRVDANGWQEVVIGPVVLRDFPLLCSNRYQKYTRTFKTSGGPVAVNCYAFPEHEYYAHAMIRIAGQALERYSRWFGPFPYPEFTIAESYFGWNGNECSSLVMIDERVFAMPHLGEGYVEYLVSHEVCHQWFYNIIGTNGYAETFLDEAFATHFAHKLLNEVKGRNNKMLNFPPGLEWLPSLHREDYRYSQMYSTLHRGDLQPAVQEMANYGHVVNLFSAVYDRGGKVVGMIEDRLGEQAFLEFMHRLYERYFFRVLTVADFQRELIEFTGDPSWADFLKTWLYSADMTDWSIEHVDVDHIETIQGSPWKATITLIQRAERDEPTVIGVSFDHRECYKLRIPIDPSRAVECDQPPAHIEPLKNRRIRVEVLLPAEPTQIAVDPDQVLPDKDPANNHWKPRLRTKFSPLLTAIDEADLTLAYDRWNILCGPAVFMATYADPWFLRESVFGPRLGLYRTQQFAGGVYAGYRPEIRDIAVGADVRLKHFPFDKTEVGMNVEKSLLRLTDDASQLDRAVFYSRYIIEETASMYLPPIHYVEGFGSYQKNFLPNPRVTRPGAERFEELSNLGVHYRADYRTPYWDPEMGLLFDATYAAGFEVFGQPEPSHQFTGQVAYIQSLPESWGWLGRTRLAMRAYGGYATPDNGLFYTLGGTNLFRGFDLAERQGSRLWVGSLEWRMPLLTRLTWDYLDHIVGIRNLYIAPFYDVGEIYLNGESLDGVAHAVGLGFRVDLAWFSFIEHTMLRLDLAKTVGQSTPMQVWLGFQHAF